MKKIAAVFVALILALAFATSASAYIVGWFSQEFKTGEPITVELPPASNGATVWPGSTFALDAKITNQADITYGMSYGGYITFTSADYTKKQLKFQLEKQPAKEKMPEVRLLQKPEQTIGVPEDVKGGDGGWGEVYFELTINGVTAPYTPYDIVNIPPSWSHFLKAIVKSSNALPPGDWQIVLSVDRQEMNPFTSHTPAPK